MVRVGDLDFAEVRRWVEVILSRVVDDPEERAGGFDAEELVDAA
jgi:hypothetical protein